VELWQTFCAWMQWRRHLFTKAAMAIFCFQWMMHVHIIMHVRDCSLRGRMFGWRSGVMQHTKGVNGKSQKPFDALTERSHPERSIQVLISLEISAIFEQYERRVLHCVIWVARPVHAASNTIVYYAWVNNYTVLDKFILISAILTILRTCYRASQ
jgi:hypothetical protein